ISRSRKIVGLMVWRPFGKGQDGSCPPDNPPTFIPGVVMAFYVLFTNLHFLVEHFTLSTSVVLLDWFTWRLSMKKVRWALPLLVLFVVPGAGQIEHMAAASQIEHAPTPDQCRADADAWGIPTAGGLFRNEEQFGKLMSSTAHDRNLTAKMIDA